MRTIWTIAKREYKVFFTSPVAYAVMLMILLIVGIIFYANLLNAVYITYVPGVDIIIGPLVTLFLFSTPALTMRTISEENRSGTLELLLTAPVRDWELIIGKWLAAFMFYLTILAITLIYPLILNSLVSPGLDWGLVFTSYLGLILMVAVLTAIGVAVSSLFSHQIAAFFVTLGIFLVLWLVGFPAAITGATTGAAAVLAYFDISQHLSDNFMRGVIELKDVVYFLSMIILSLFLGSVSIEARRWR